jgi:nucleotide-binding universal stress UspA family protein
MSSRVLVAVDGSPLSLRAFDLALAEHPDAAVVVLHVIDPSEPGYSVPFDGDTRYEPLHGSEEWYDRAEEATDELFADLHERAGEATDRLATVSAVGDPARLVVEHAEEEAVDRVFVGSHGRESPDTPLLGRVAELVVSRCPVTVTVVREPTEE